jgi:predicted aminopeptidase
VAGQTAYNESLATFVAEIEGERFLRDRFGADSKEVKQFIALRARREKLQGFIGDAFRTLDALYRIGAGRSETVSRRDELYAALRSDHEEQDLTSSVFESDRLNNARLMLNRAYHRSAWWKKVYDHVEGEWSAFFELARRAGRSRDPFLEMDRLLSRSP